MTFTRHVIVLLGLALLAANSMGASNQQSGSSVDTSPVPPHSGKAAGPSGPKSTPPPSAHDTKNAVSNGEDNSPVRTFTGTVSDSLCGRHHYLLTNGTDAECTRYCIAHQSTYVLVVGDKIYALVNQPGHVLDALAGKKARVTGALVGGNVLEVNSASPVQNEGK